MLEYQVLSTLRVSTSSVATRLKSFNTVIVSAPITLSFQRSLLKYFVVSPSPTPSDTLLTKESWMFDCFQKFLWMATTVKFWSGRPSESFSFVCMLSTLILHLLENDPLRRAP